MKYVVLVPDGCADEPLAELNGRTPLEAAAMPALSRLAARAEVGRAAVIPEGLPPGSDVGNMAILGYDPARFHTGRAPIEAAAMGVELGPDDVAFRCNLVTLDDAIPPTMVDFAAGHPTSEQSASIIAALDAELGGGRDGVRFYPGVEYRHLCVVPRELGDAECVPPHDLTGKPAVLPVGPAAEKLIALMEASKPIDAAHRDAALASLEDRDFFLLHVEATDEAAHQGEVHEKVLALERWDREIIAPLSEALDGARTPYRILLLPDHATPCAIKTHTSA